LQDEATILRTDIVPKHRIVRMPDIRGRGRRIGLAVPFEFKFARFPIPAVVRMSPFQRHKLSPTTLPASHDRSRAPW
jgi:hypothetical protein